MKCWAEPLLDDPNPSPQQVIAPATVLYAVAEPTQLLLPPAAITAGAVTTGWKVATPGEVELLPHAKGLMFPLNPICPLLPRPQHITLPLFAIAQLCSAPALSALKAIVLIATGDVVPGSGPA